jgi:Spermine/spermidine synthase domain
MLLAESLAPNDTWSPYYKITAVRPPGTHGVLRVSGNDIPYQTLYPLATLRRLESFYFFPYRHVTRSDLANVLVIGAGTGNDVGVALAEGARHVDAVEIDPVLVQLGREDNPEHAYQSPRVTVHIDDGRSFLQDTHSTYSLVIYALPDSLTALGGQAAPVGLENYLLTVQAFQEARAHLARDGTFVMYNYYEPFLLDRYATTVTTVFGHRPCVELGNSLGDRQQAVLTVGATAPARHCTTVWHGRPRAPATDDRPFPYLPTATIPVLYRWLIGLVLVASLVVVRAAAGRLRPVARYADLFWMGAAFMLLESKNVVQFALLFGTTWYVNSLVFGGVLASVYLAVELARHVMLPRPSVLYAALVAWLAAAWLVPGSWLLSLPPIPRFVAATALAFGPIFIANLVFASRFGGVEATATPTAFGANLLGAIVGGALEYLSMVTGFRFLLVLVAALYGLALLFGRRRTAAAARS